MRTILTGPALCCALIASGLTACGTNADNCELTLTCGAGASSGTGGSGGSGGSVDPGCVPSTLQAGTPLPETCTGVFVSGSSGSDTTGDGSRAAPYASLAKAVSESAAVIYACAEPTADTATVTLPGGTTLFGGLDCADFSYSGTKSTLAPGAPIALVLEAGGGIDIEDFDVEAAPGATPGGSSIGILANGSTAGLHRVDVSAGAGAPGESGTTPTDNIGPSDPTDVAIKGENGNPANTTTPTNPNPSGAGTANSLCDTAIGGNGGTGGSVAGATVNDAGNGTDGLPALGFGAHGVGETSAGGWNCVPGQGLGIAGANGAAGTAGTGGAALGTLSASGYAGAVGLQGGKGDPGQGGGGGGGARGQDAVPDVRGASGGGGGSGGCGGYGGLGGGAAGASIAIVSLGGTWTFDGVTLATAQGGQGGDGGIGQGGAIGGNGGNGGNGISGTLAACAGGQGGQGGQGGRGGGGRGGHSLGIGFTGTAPDTAGASFQLDAPGQGGLGAGPSGNGLDGVGAETQGF
ncbi:MAG: hypothetical protein IT373_14610 [Polyangiaceae bacterium]|nr:hypothetical protein [Polyangiaceae bacterium]